MYTNKSKTETHVVAIYPDHTSAEDAVRRPQANGIPMKDVSIIGKNFQATEKPIGFVTAGSLAKDGAKIGAWSGGLFGLLIGAGVLILPGVGPVIIAGPLAAVLLGGLEGTFAGAAVGGISGALVGLGMSKDKAIRYESAVVSGRSLVAVQGDAGQIERARSLLSGGKAESAEVVGPPATAA